jgi:AcrR family transcriptional regulator
VAAFIDLVGESGRQPTIEEVAGAAGVSVRSVYRLFPDTDSLVGAAIAAQTDAMRPLLELDVAPTAPLEARVTELVSRRARAYDRVRAIRGVVAAQRSAQPSVARLVDDSRAALRRQVIDLFGKELGKRSGTGRNDLVEALEMATGWGAWDALRQEQGLSAARARRVMEATVLSLLASRRF